MIRNLLIANILSFGICSESDEYFINHLIEIGNKVTRPFNNELISGKIYRSFDDPSLNHQFIGEVVRSIKDGEWTGWWTDGKIKYKGSYASGQKIGFWHEWDDNGVLRFESLYFDGRVVQLKNCLLEDCDSSLLENNIEVKF